MPITKNHLSQIAAVSFKECYENMNASDDHCSNYITIKGDHEKILAHLEDLCEIYNGRNEDSIYRCFVKRKDDTYEFMVLKMESEDAEYEYQGEEEEIDTSEVIAESAHLEDADGEEGDDEEWNAIRQALLQPHCGAFWATDHLTLALNWGNCINEKKHPKTTEEEWDICMDSFNYTHDGCYKIYKALCPERIALFWKIEKGE